MRSRYGTRWKLLDSSVGWVAFVLGFAVSPYVTELPSTHYLIIVGGLHGVLLMSCARLCGVPNPERRSSTYELVSHAAIAALLAYALFSIVVWFVLVRTYGRYIVFTMEGVTLLGMIGPRWLVRRFLAQHPINVVIYGAGASGVRLLERIKGDPHFKVLGVLDRDQAPRGTDVDGVPGLGRIQDYAGGDINRLGADVVVICVGRSLSPENARLLLRLPLEDVEVLNKGAFIETYFRETSIEYQSPHWFASSPSVPGSASVFAAKRMLDLLVAVPALVLALPFMVLIVLAIRLDSSGPALFRQRRVGWRGREFEILKFRSMRVDAEKGGAQWAAKNDPRVTRVGRFLRRTRLDELPQLWSVIVGDMALVGPRPERPEFVRELAAEIPLYEQRHLVPPGLTGWAQIRYRYGASKEEAGRKLEFDLYYLRHLSMAFDLEILLRTIPLLMTGSR